MTHTPRQGCTVLPDINLCLSPPPLLPFGSPRPVRLGCPAHKHAYKSLVCVAPEEDPAPAQWRSRERVF